jgi:glycosyltransferase involved in cell wall biosynthesis
MPKISILVPVRNSGKYLSGTLDTVVNQTFTDWEVVIKDGMSTDDTLAVAKRYAAAHPNIKVVSGPDEGSNDAVVRAFRESHGEYVLMLCAGDGYLTDRWLEMCIRALDEDPEISLVWGIPFDMSEEGKLLGPHFAYGNFLGKAPGNTGLLKELIKRVAHPSSLLRLVRRANLQTARSVGGMLKKREVPQKQDWFWYWLDTGVQFPDGNTCMSRRLFEELVAPRMGGPWKPGTWTNFYFSFNTQGYLARCFPIPASFARLTRGRLSDQLVTRANVEQSEFFEKLAEFRKKIKAHPEKMVFRARSGEPITVK